MSQFLLRSLKKINVFKSLWFCINEKSLKVFKFSNLACNDMSKYWWKCSLNSAKLYDFSKKILGWAPYLGFWNITFWHHLFISRNCVKIDSMLCIVSKNFLCWAHPLLWYLISKCYHYFFAKSTIFMSRC